MKLSAPKMVTWWVAVILGLLSLIVRYVQVPPILYHYYLFMAAGWLVLVVATVIDFL
jgi:hypothetical protein